MNKANVYYLLLVACSLNCIASNAQTVTGTVNFKTPEVSSFNRNIETPVSFYSGVPGISIPLYEIKMKDVSVPISLDYHAGGIRVDQEASWVGLGWNISYGGQISRKVRGVADEKYYFIGGTTDTSLSVDYFKDLPLTTQSDLELRLSYLTDAKFGNKDYMPDEFHYSTLGYSGKFMYSQQQNKFMTFPREDIKINQFPNESGTILPFYKWQLNLPNGNLVEFGKDGITSERDMSASDNIKSSWLIKKIKNIYSDSLEYFYDNFNYSSWKFASQKYSYYHTNGDGQDELNGIYQTTSIPHFTHYDAKLERINFPDGSIFFISDNRDDMPGTALYQIHVRDRDSNLIKKVLFHYSYFNGNKFDFSSYVDGSTSYVSADFKSKRLKLDSISIYGSGTDCIKYRFDYYTLAQLPSKYTFSQDHWGFYNGLANTTAYSFIPKNAFFVAGGDRRVKADSNKVFSLKSVTYPEGGRTEFEYESNTAGVWNTPHDLLETYQDDNFIEHNEGISVSSYSRSTSYPSPDSTDLSGLRYFKRQFTIGSNGYSHLGLGWYCHTDFGISSLETTTPYSADNVEFKLERIESNNSRTLIRSFNTTDQSSPYARTTTNELPIFLVQGNYEMTVRLTYSNPIGSPAEDQPYNLYFHVKWRELDSTKNAVHVGGLRIKNINYYLQDATLARKKSFKYVNPNISIANFTSGRIVSFPKYYNFTIRRLAGIPTVSYNAMQYGMHFVSNSVLPLETTSGSYSGYEYVDEYDVNYNDTSQKLKTSYYFSFDQPYFSQYHGYTHLGVWEAKEWSRGKLKEKKYYNGTNVVRKEEYDYYSWSPHLTNLTDEDFVEEINTDLISKQYLYQFITTSSTPEDFFDDQPPLSDDLNQSFYGLSSSCRQFYYGAGNYYFNTTYSAGITNPWCPDNISLPHFLHYTAFDKLKSKKITEYDKLGASLVSNEDYFYQNTPGLHQLTKTQLLDSRGDTLKSILKYPKDFTGTTIYDAMISRNMISNVIEQSTYKNAILLQSNKTNYYDWGNFIAPNSVEEKLLGNAYEVKMNINAFDEKGNILNSSKAGNLATSYVWGYSNQYPIAQAMNAGSGSVAYTSFEADDAGNWSGISSGSIQNTGGITGNKFYSNSSFSISKSGLTSGHYYTVSYWSKNGAYSITGTQSGYPKTLHSITINSETWTLFEHLVTGQTTITITGNGAIDELRLYPKGSLMTTYTYTPLVGLTTQCDVNNRISFYEYDSFGRLIRIRDQEKNILKAYDYKYASQ